MSTGSHQEDKTVSIEGIPPTWQSTPVNYLFRIVGGDGFAPELQGESSGDLPFLKNSDISSGITRISTAANYVSHALARREGFSLVPPKSILMGKIGESMKKNHRVLNTVACCIDNNMQAMVPDVRLITPEYGLYALKLLNATDFNNGGPVPSINNVKWKRARIPIPLLHEQRLIANVLDDKLAKIDQAMSLLRRELETMERLKKSLIYEAVTKGLDPTVPMKPSGVEWIGDIPEHWRTTRIKYIAPAWNGLTYDPADVSDTGTPVLRSGNIQNGELDLQNLVRVVGSIPEKAFARSGDILICSRNGSRNLIGKNALIRQDGYAFGAFMMIARPTVNSQYFHHLLNSGIFDFYLPTYLTSTVNQLTGTNFGNMIVPITDDPDEQLAIVEELNTKCKALDVAMEKKRAQLSLLRKEIDSVIFEYVTGKRRVSEVA
jgi:putative type I restriction-modification system specificity determinant for hsdM and hsdR (hsdS)